MLPSADWTTTAVEVALRRDYEPAAARVPGVDLGIRLLTGPWVSTVVGLRREGVRQVRIAEPVDLCADADLSSAHALMLIRELTAQAIVVDWTARCRDGCASRGRFAHLYPPSRVDGTDDRTTADRWRRSFFFGKCLFRRGPGFTEVRDRRLGTLEMLTIDEPEHLAAIRILVEGVPAELVPATVRRDLADADLIVEQAGHLWWLPTSAYRWPFPAFLV
jgi:hypothetical protein